MATKNRPPLRSISPNSEQWWREQSPGYTIEAGLQALKAAMAANGGAALALLAFFGDFDRAAASAETLESMGQALFAFVMGVAATVVAFYFRYFSQACYGGQYGGGKRAIQLGDRLRNACIAVTMMSLIAFTYGGFKAATALAHPVRTQRPANAATPAAAQPGAVAPAAQTPKAVGAKDGKATGQ